MGVAIDRNEDRNYFPIMNRENNPQDRMAAAADNLLAHMRNVGVQVKIVYVKYLLWSFG